MEPAEGDEDDEEENEGKRGWSERRGEGAETERTRASWVSISGVGALR